METKLSTETAFGSAVHRYVHGLMTQPARTIVDRCCQGLLALLAGVMGWLWVLRRQAYRLGWLRCWQVRCPVICVGNLTLGGTGKTPMVEWLAKQLGAEGYKVVVLSRGYGGSWRERRRRGNNPVVYLADGVFKAHGHKFIEWEAAADEPQLLARHLDEVPVVVGRNRVRSARFAIDALGAQVLLLDDGFQHWRLQRDLDVVLLDALEPFGNGHLLPRGILREPPEALARAGMVVLTKADRVTEERRALLKAIARQYCPEALCVEAVHAWRGCVDALTQEPVETAALRQRGAAAVSAIGDPGSFESLVSDAGIEPAWRVRFPDHHRFRAADVAMLREGLKARGLSWLLTTEKDWMRLQPLWQVDRAVRVGVVQMELQVMEQPDVILDRLRRVLAR